MRVRVYATLRPIVGSREAPTHTKPGQPVSALIDELVTRWPGLRPEMVDSQGQLLNRIQIFVNGRSIRHLAGLDTPIP
ncbi:MAG: MoaD/ThiS family protein, partial [Anaerolineae bacterium]